MRTQKELPEQVVGWFCCPMLSASATLTRTELQVRHVTERLGTGSPDSGVCIPTHKLGWLTPSYKRGHKSLCPVLSCLRCTADSMCAVANDVCPPPRVGWAAAGRAVTSKRTPWWALSPNIQEISEVICFHGKLP